MAVCSAELDGILVSRSVPKVDTSRNYRDFIEYNLVMSLDHEIATDSEMHHQKGWSLMCR